VSATAAAPAVVEPSPDEPPERLEHQVGVGAAWKLIGQVVIQGVRLVTVAVLARLLVPSDYGAAAIAIALAGFAPTVADMGLGAALVQTRVATRVTRSTTFWASVACGIALSVLVALAAGPVGHLLDDSRVGPLVAVGGLTLAICAVSSASQAIYMREMRFRALELRYWLATAVASSVAVAAAVLGAGAWALVLQQVVLVAIFAAALWWRAGWRPTFEFSLTEFRALGSFAIRVAGGRWARLAELLVLTVLVGSLLSVSALGAWSFAMSTVILPLTVIAIPTAEVLFAAFSRLRGDRARIADLWLGSIRILAAVILPLLVGLVIIAPDLIPTVFGAHWVVSVGVVQVLSVYVIVRSLQSWGSVLMDAVGRPQVTLWTQLGALCLTPVGVVVGSQWGVEAVAVGFVLSQLIAVEVPMLIIVLSELRVSPLTLGKRLFAVVAATAVMAAACLAARAGLLALGVGMAGRAALTIVVGAVVYGVALWILAPDIGRRATTLGRRAIAKARDGRRRRAEYA
jgi:polysaccharide transporter, PST family